MGISVVPADPERPANSQEQQGEGPTVAFGVTATEVAATLEETLQHIESVGRPHDWWWTLNNWRKRHAQDVFGRARVDTLEAILTSKYWLLITVIITLFCLYAADVCDATACSESARTVMSALLLSVFIIYAVELILASIFVENYMLSFFFGVDLIGTASLILDIQWFIAGILDAEESNSLQISRAGRAAKIGSQMGRITRVLRMFRSLRLLKVLQLCRQPQQGRDIHGLGQGPMRPTVLGELLADSTTRKCIIIIMFVLVVTTFLQTHPTAAVADYSRIQLVSYGIMTPQAFVQSARHPIIRLSYVDTLSGGRLVHVVPYTRSNMRSFMQLRTAIECAHYSGTEVEACGFTQNFNTVWYDITKLQQLNAGLNMILTSIIIASLGLSAYFFGRDATTYVIVPIETMLKYLKRMITMGLDADCESEYGTVSKAPETDLLANYVSRLVHEIDNARWKAEEEARISDTLLNSMVPPRIAKKLKELRWWEAGPEQRAQTIADSFPHATVLFTDIVGFTVLSSRISAEDAMRHLNNMYTIFDEIVEKYGLYKVETIGDSYMLVGGAPEERTDHAERVAAAALEIRACVPLLQQISGEPGINVRIGMHSGAVTAGVVGFKNPRWHLFGDTCNTASRMESTGIAGEIQLSCTTYELIKERFQSKVRGKIAVKGKGEMVTYLLEREYDMDNPPDCHSSAILNSGGLGAVGGSSVNAMDREAFLSSPQFKKALERYTTARNSFLAEEEELCKLLKSLDEAVQGTKLGVASGAALQSLEAGTAEGAAIPAAGVHTTPEAVAAAGAVVPPRLAARLPTGSFKQLLLGPCTSLDLKALALHMHEELVMARAMMAAAEEDKVAGIRRDMLLKLYARVLEAPGMSLRDTFAAILDTLYNVIECDVIKMYVVDHAREQLWPATRHSTTDATRTLPLKGTLAGQAVRRARVIRVDDVAVEEDFNAELEELPAGYTSKSMMCVPVFSASNSHSSGHNSVRLYSDTNIVPHYGIIKNGFSHTGMSNGSSSPAQLSLSPAAGPGPGDVIAVLVLVNRWTPWREAGAEEGERCIVPFSAADETPVRDAAASVGLLLVRRRGEMLLASAVSPSCVSFRVAALPASVARVRLRRVVRRSSVTLLDMRRGNLWAMKPEELMGQARDVLSALQRRVTPSALSVLGAAGEEALVSYLVRLADEQGAGRFFNLAHSVGVLQGVYLTLNTHAELATALGPQHLLALVLAASLLNIDRDGEVLSAAPVVGGAVAGGPTNGGGSGAVGRAFRSRTSASTAVAVAAATAAAFDQGVSPPSLLPLMPKQTPSQKLQHQTEEAQAHSQFLLPLAPVSSHVIKSRSRGMTGSWRSSEPGFVIAGPQVREGSPQQCGATLPPLSSTLTVAARGTMPAAAATPSSPETVVPQLSGAADAPEEEAHRHQIHDSGGIQPPGSVPVSTATGPPGQAEEAPDQGIGTVGTAAAASPRNMHEVAQNSLTTCVMSLPVPSATTSSVPGPASFTADAALASAPAAGGATAGAGSTPSTPSIGHVGRLRSTSPRRGRLAALVEDILGESNLLSALPPKEAAAVKVFIVSLLVLRNQPASILSMPELQLHRGSRVIDDAVAGDCSGVTAAAAGGVATAVKDGNAAASTSGIGTAALETFLANTEILAADVVRRSDGGGGGGDGKPHDDHLNQTGGVEAQEAAAKHDVKELVSPAAEQPASLLSTGGGGGGGQPSELSMLNTLMQATGSDPIRLAATRTAVCALLLAAWSELLHLKDTSTALSLLQCRATDVRSWASRRAANVSSRRRSVTLLGAVDHAIEDVQSLLLLEVPRVQLEVVPLWQRTVEMLPGLQSHLDSVQANRATYVSMLQDTASLATAPLYGGGDGAVISGHPNGNVAVSPPGASSGDVPLSVPSPSLLHGAALRSVAALNGVPSSREPRRFVSIQQRGRFALPRGMLAVMPSGDSIDSSSATAGAFPSCLRYIRASSSRSYGGRNSTEDFDSSTAESGNATGGVRPPPQGVFPVNSSGGARTMHRFASRSGHTHATSMSRLGFPSSSNVTFVAVVADSAAPPSVAGSSGIRGLAGVESDGGRQLSNSKRPFLTKAPWNVTRQETGFRPRSQTIDLCLAPSASVTALPSDHGTGQRWTSITSRFNNLFTSFRLTSRASLRSHISVDRVTSGLGGGGSSHSHMYSIVSPVTGTPGMPQSTSQLFPNSSSLDVFNYGYSVHDGSVNGAGGNPYYYGSHQQPENLPTADSAALRPFEGTVTVIAEPLSPTGSLQAYGGGVGGRALKGPSLDSSQQPQLLQSSQSTMILSPVFSARRPSAPTISIVSAGAEYSGLTSDSGTASPSTSATTPVISPRRAGLSKGNVRGSLMRHLSLAASRLPFRSSHGEGGSGHGNSGGAAAQSDGSQGPQAMEACAPLRLSAGGAGGAGSSGGGSALTFAAAASTYGGEVIVSGEQQQSPLSLPMPKSIAAPSLPRCGTLSQGERARGQLHAPPPYPHPELPDEEAAALQAAAAGATAAADATSAGILRPGLVSSPPQRQRVPAPSGALALAHQHEQYAATVAAAALAFAASRSVEATSGGGCDDDEEDKTGALGRGTSMPLFLGSSLISGEALPTVVENSGSYPNSATGTATMNSTGAAVIETAKHTWAVAGAPSSFVGNGAGTVGAAAPPNLSRFVPAPAFPRILTEDVFPPPAVADGMAAPALLAAPPASPLLQSRCTAGTTPYLFRGSQESPFVDISVSRGAVLSTAATSMPRSRCRFSADGGVDHDEVLVAPHHASSKGVWLGLRLANDVIRSMGRWVDSAGVRVNAATVPSEQGPAVLPEADTNRFPGVVVAGSSSGGGGGGGGVGLYRSNAMPPASPSRGAMSSTGGSCNPSRMQTPASSLRRGGTSVHVGAGGVVSLQALIDIAEAALGSGSAAPCSPSRFECRDSLGGMVSAGGPGLKQSQRPTLSVGHTGTRAGSIGRGVVDASTSPQAANSTRPSPPWFMDDIANQRTSAPQPQTRLSLRRAAASRTFAE